MSLSWGSSFVQFDSIVKAQTPYVRKEIDKIIDKTGDDVHRWVAASTPVDTGLLKKSWVLKKSRKRKRLRVDITNKVFYANFVENGTIKMAPRRMLRKAKSRGRRVMRRRLESLKVKLARRFKGV